MSKDQPPWFKSLESSAVRKTIDPLLAEILLAVARPPQLVRCPKCESLYCGPVRCRFEDPK